MLKTEEKKYSFSRISLRSKALLVILPVLLCSFIISGYLSGKAYKKSINNIGMQFTVFKAQQFEKYSDMQWNFLVENKLYENEIFLDTVRESIQLFSGNMIKKNDEVIFAVFSDGKIAFSTDEIDISESEKKSLIDVIRRQSSGWVEVSVSGIDWTGYKFYYPPFYWHVFILEKNSSFYSMMRKINFQHYLIMFISSVVAALLISLFIKYLTTPIKKVADGLSNMADLDINSQHIEIEYPDEIGELAYEFNVMSSKLGRSYKKLRKIAINEALARKKVSLREFETLDVLGRASEYKDPETGAHIARVAYYSKMLSSLLNESLENQDLIFHVAPLHDIGKLGIKDSILLKPGKLTTEEFSVMKKHTLIGYEILKNSNSIFLQKGAEIALTHHEKYDGSGYPSGLEGEEIPLFGRIVCIADVFDALTSKRSYKEPWSLKQAAELIESEKGKSFDPEIATLFLDNFNTVKSIYAANQENAED